MMRKSRLVLIIVISALMFYVGCDDNDGGGGGEGPPPGGGVPPPEACDNCPCNFFNVPQTSDCWSLGITPNPTFTTQASEQFASCSIALNNPDAEVFADLITQVSQGAETGGTCQISITNPFVMVPKECQDAQVAQTNVSAEQIQDCRTCLQDYATALNDSVGLTNQPPYMCATPPPEGGGVQPPAACNNCPCNFFSVPMTAGCWVSDDTGPTFDTNTEGPGARCSVHPVDVGFDEGIFAIGSIEFGCSNGAQACCRIKGLGNENCNVADVPDQAISFGQLTSCEACIEEYATSLNDELDTGVSGGPPYACTKLQ